MVCDEEVPFYQLLWRQVTYRKRVGVPMDAPLSLSHFFSVQDMELLV